VDRGSTPRTSTKPPQGGFFSAWELSQFHCAVRKRTKPLRLHAIGQAGNRCKATSPHFHQTTARWFFLSLGVLAISLRGAQTHQTPSAARDWASQQSL